MGQVQDLFNANTGGDFILTSSEYEGPLVVDRSCVIDGCKSTLWANNGPVLVITAPNVTVKNLRIEVTGNPADEQQRIAVKTSDPNTKLENVEVCGNVVGIPQESESWDLPGIISLGEFASNKKNTFTIHIKAPADAKLDTSMKNIQVVPDHLTMGDNSLTFITDELRHNTILYGEIMVRTGVSRRIYVSGKAMKDSPVYEDLPAVNGPTVSMPVQVDPPVEIIAPNVPDAVVKELSRGQRVSVKELNANQIKVIFEHKGAAPGMDIDSYCFALQGNGKVSCDEDLIFFGNTEAANQSIKSLSSEGKPIVFVDLDKVDASVQRIAVCYSIYGDDAGQNFSMISAPTIRIFGGDKEVFRFEIKDLKEEKTVVATEIYRYKGEWKMNFVGAGYRSGLKQLCESYGVDVE